VDAELKHLPKAIGSLIDVLVLPTGSARDEPSRVIAALLDALLATVSLQAALLDDQQRVVEELEQKVAQETRALQVMKLELERALREELKAKASLASTTLHQRASIPHGGLAPWQARRAQELMNANLDGKLPLRQLAEQCGLSTRHFARAFRQSTGVPPHRWLLGRRVERAKDLMRDPALSLAEVALACGFADQSHFTRMFTTVVGVSPGVWRRTRSRQSAVHSTGGESANCLSVR